MKTANTHLNYLISERRKITEQRNNTWDEEKSEYSNEYYKEYDNNRDLILNLIKENLEALSFEDILEAYSHTGGAPCLIYDDNGNWAITTEGYQSISLEDEPQDLQSSFLVEARFFKPNIRDAVKYWFDDMFESINQIS